MAEACVDRQDYIDCGNNKSILQTAKPLVAMWFVSKDLTKQETT